MALEDVVRHHHHDTETLVTVLETALQAAEYRNPALSQNSSGANDLFVAMLDEDRLDPGLHFRKNPLEGFEAELQRARDELERKILDWPELNQNDINHAFDIMNSWVQRFSDRFRALDTNTATENSPSRLNGEGNSLLH